jgi:hypothetical protein
LKIGESRPWHASHVRVALEKVEIGLVVERVHAAREGALCVSRVAQGHAGNGLSTGGVGEAGKDLGGARVKDVGAFLR